MMKRVQRRVDQRRSTRTASFGGGRRSSKASRIYKNISPEISTPLLDGAFVYLLVPNSTGGSASIDIDMVTAVAETIVALGGTIADRMEEATHTMLLCGSAGEDDDREDTTPPILDDATHALISKSQGLNIPVVDKSWLQSVSGLAPDGDDQHHWSRISVGAHQPRALQRQSATSSVSSTANIRRDSSKNMGAALSQTYGLMTKDNPENMEEAYIQRAIELSMLDLALVFRPDNPSFTSLDNGTGKKEEMTPHQILGVAINASPADIKAAYKRKARETHPDKGGDPAAFEAVARSYRTLLRGSQKEPSLQHRPVIKSTAHWDNELRDHQTLVNELFQNHETNLSAVVTKMDQLVKSLGLCAKDAGASNINENNEKIANSCFYLSLATSYLHGIGALTDDDDLKKRKTDEHSRSADEALIGETALDLKRTIEAAVVHAHPEWAEQGKVGEEVQAFSDFLVYVLDSPTILSDWAVAVFDSVSGFVDIYKGKNYTERDQGWAQSNTISLKYVPGHYQPLLPSNGTTRPELSGLLEALDASGVFYVVTNGSEPDETS